jgi:hypothetical protein
LSSTGQFSLCKYPVKTKFLPVSRNTPLRLRNNLLRERVPS